LKASTPEDAKKLVNHGYNGFVYLIGDILMTICAMLKVTKEGCVSDSYDDSQDRLKEIGIDVNYDTIRAVTNKIEELVLADE
jgi:hypothetical protein